MKEIAVVGAVITREGLVLCAQRGDTAQLAGLWEFPGGKLEQGETGQEALRREVLEELRCLVEVGDEVTTTTHDYDFARITLTTYWASLVQGSPETTEHAELRWVAPESLRSLEWAPADIPAVDLIQRAMAA